jgi:mannose-6-phosphate isomerase-like protein (cupin superfamily)
MLKTSLSELPIQSVSHNPAIKKKVFVKKGQMGNITQIALATFLPGQVAPTHSHQDMYETFIIQSGSGTIEIDKRMVNVKVGDCVLVSPGEFHEVKNTGEEVMEILNIAEEIPKV